MTDHDTLLAAIRDSPDDDAPRLIYADWLEEHGEPERAEFIRVQCRLARINLDDVENAVARLCDDPDCTANPCVWKRREREIWEAGTHPLREWFGVAGNHDISLFINPKEAARFATRPAFIVRRGWVEAVTLSAADAVAHLDAVLVAQPVTTVTLTDRPVIQFGPVRLSERHDDGLDLTTLRAEWEARWSPNIIGQRFGYVLNIGRRELFMGREAESRARFDAHVEAARTAEGYLRARWERVRTWHLPPET